MSARRRGGVGLADLLEARIGYEDRGASARALAMVEGLLGYEREPQLVQDVSTGGVASDGAAEGVNVGTARPSTVAHGVPLWQPRELRWHDEPERLTHSAEDHGRYAAEEEEERKEMDAREPPSVPLLSPRRRVMPMLEHELVGELPGDDLDVDELVRRVSRGLPVRELPRMRRRAWPTLVVLVDRDWALVPVWEDQQMLHRWLEQVVGASALVVRYVDERGPEEGLLDLEARPAAWDGGLVGMPVLALTDLGWYRGHVHQRAWLRLGRRLRRAGERIHALVPVPRARWTRALAEVWSPIEWERSTAAPAEGAEPEPRMQRARRLLAMAACANRLEPGLLRALRLSLPPWEADVGTEMDAWLDEELAGWFPTATVVQVERAEALRAELREEDAAAVVEALRRWHWHRQRQPELWHAEVLTLDRVGGAAGAVAVSERERAEAFAERLGARARAARVEGKGLPEGLREWLDYVEQRAPKGLWDSNSKVGRGLQRAWWATHEDDRMPPFADPMLRAEARGERVHEPRTLELWQVGRRLGVGPRTAGSRVAGLEVAGDRVTVVEPSGLSTDLSEDLGTSIELRPRNGVEVRTDRMTLQLSVLVKPRWARAIGRDRFGLWAELRVGEVSQRMRWIGPGRFRMGSPDGEPGRFEWEGPQHEVVITRGFWIGETPVTQALWRAVTGEDPSRFKGEDRPVESVSWEDCHSMIQQLDEIIGEDLDEGFRLPTEAEWEYACRAGTETATYAGAIEIRGEHDAPVLDEISWYGGNSGVGYGFDDGADTSDWKEMQHPTPRAGTRRVGEKRPNPWGLYDMLGNVWEWCVDSWDYGTRYSDDPQQDPSGPAAGEVRVLRGGSWYELARVVRAACRGGAGPGDRGGDLGLRLVRGQAVRRPGGPDSASPQAGENRSSAVLLERARQALSDLPPERR